MRILFLSQLIPYPPDAGAKVRSYYVLRWLAARHEVTLLAFMRHDDDEESVKHLEEFCERVITVPMRRSLVRNISSLARSVLMRESFIIGRDTVGDMRKAIRKLFEEEKFDAVHSDQLWMAQYALLANDLQPNLRLILDEHNACFQIFERLARGEPNHLKRWIWKREATLLKLYEAHVCRRFKYVVTVTDEDRRTLQELSGGGEWLTIPICMDTQIGQAVHVAKELKNVLHLGTMFWPPNIEGMLWFGSEVWPKVVEMVNDVSMTIVGKSPPPELIKLMEDHPNVKMVGYVKDVYPFIEAAGVFIVPLLSGGGMRVKIIDAWRWGLPVVSTSIGAEGIAYRNGENILIADGEEAFAKAVAQVLCDFELSNRLRVNGRRWVEERYEWTNCYAQWESVYKEK